MEKNKKQHIKALNEISNMMSTVKTLNEAVMFEDDFDDYSDDYTETNDEKIDEPIDKPLCDDGECDIDEMNDIDRIREIALKGMLKYVKQSNSSEYETLKKIFQFCDKVNNDKPEEVEKK